MKERPILFSSAMVRALLDGSKTQMRRVVKSKFEIDYLPLDLDGPIWPHHSTYSDAFEDQPMPCPYGQPGDRLWVRESFSKIIGQTAGWIETDYKATYKHGDRMGDLMGAKKKWTPSIHMPRDASRITMEIVSVRVERLRDISEPDASAEGLIYDSNRIGHWSGTGEHWFMSARDAYRNLWESINGPNSWDANPWVWTVEFKRVTS